MDAITATTAIAEAAAQVLGTLNEMDNSKLPFRYRRSLSNLEAKSQLALNAIHNTATQVACMNKVLSDALSTNIQFATQNATALSIAINSMIANYNTITDERARSAVLDYFYSTELPTLLENCKIASIDFEDLRERILKYIR